RLTGIFAEEGRPSIAASSLTNFSAFDDNGFTWFETMDSRIDRFGSANVFDLEQLGARNIVDLAFDDAGVQQGRQFGGERKEIRTHDEIKGLNAELVSRDYELSRRPVENCNGEHSPQMIDEVD